MSDYVYIVRMMSDDTEVARFDRIQEAFTWRMENDLMSVAWIEHKEVA